MLSQCLCANPWGLSEGLGPIGHGKGDVTQACFLAQADWFGTRSMWESDALQHLILVIEPSAPCLCAPRGPDLAMVGGAAPPLPFQVVSRHCPRGLRCAPRPRLSQRVPPSPLLLQEQPLPLAASLRPPTHCSFFSSSPPPLSIHLRFLAPPAHRLQWASAPPARTGLTGLCSLPSPSPSWHMAPIPALISRWRGCSQEHLNGAGDSLGPLG